MFVDQFLIIMQKHRQTQKHRLACVSHAIATITIANLEGVRLQ